MTTTDTRRGIGRRGFLRGLAAVAVAAIAGPVLGSARALSGAVGVTVTIDNRTGGRTKREVAEAVDLFRQQLSVMCRQMQHITAADIKAAIRRAMGDAADVVECVQVENGGFQVRARLRDNLRLPRYTSNIPSTVLRGFGVGVPS